MYIYYIYHIIYIDTYCNGKCLGSCNPCLAAIPQLLSRNSNGTVLNRNCKYYIYIYTLYIFIICIIYIHYIYIIYV